MKLLLAPAVVKRFIRELKRARRREIGGLLMGEHVGDAVFRIVDFSVQHAGGTHSHFVRDPREHQAQLNAFFERTSSDFKTFNYIGEWHSHPSFAPVPSGEDISTMRSIVADPAVGVNFLVLLVLRLHRRRLHMSATAFRVGNAPHSIDVEGETAHQAKSERSALSWIRRLFRK